MCTYRYTLMTYGFWNINDLMDSGTLWMFLENSRNSPIYLQYLTFMQLCLPSDTHVNFVLVAINSWLK